MVGPSEIVPLDDVSDVVPEHAEVSPLLPETDAAVLGGAAVGAEAAAVGLGVDPTVAELPAPPPAPPPPVEL